MRVGGKRAEEGCGGRRRGESRGGEVKGGEGGGMEKGGCMDYGGIKRDREG